MNSLLYSNARDCLYSIIDLSTLNPPLRSRKDGKNFNPAKEVLFLAKLDRFRSCEMLSMSGYPLCLSFIIGWTLFAPRTPTPAPHFISHRPLFIAFSTRFANKGLLFTGLIRFIIKNIVLRFLPGVQGPS